MTRPPSGPMRSPRRAQWVWSLFAASMTAVGGVLLLLDHPAPHQILAATTPGIRGTNAPRPDCVLPTAAPLERERWNAIVVHHSGLPAGDAASIERHQQGAGITGLGYHFVIGNGHGAGDGEIHVGYRWNRQLPGAHVAEQPLDHEKHDSGARTVNLRNTSAGEMNEHAVGICLVGNGDRSPFTPRQIREVIALVRALQRELGIPATEVYLHRDISAVSSPGERFPVAEFESQLLP